MFMDITRLKSGIEEYTSIDSMYSFSKEQLQGTDLIELNNVRIMGDITCPFENFHLSLEVSGVMVLPCAISLKPVTYPFKLMIDEDLEDNLQENLKNVENSLDILPIIWENILMEIPLKVVSEDLSDVKTSGDGWKIITDEEKHTNSYFDELKDLL